MVQPAPPTQPTQQTSKLHYPDSPASYKEAPTPTSRLQSATQERYEDGSKLLEKRLKRRLIWISLFFCSILSFFLSLQGPTPGITGAKHFTFFLANSPNPYLRLPRKQRSLDLLKSQTPCTSSFSFSIIPPSHLFSPFPCFCLWFSSPNLSHGQATAAPSVTLWLTSPCHDLIKHTK